MDQQASDTWTTGGRKPAGTARLVCALSALAALAAAGLAGPTAAAAETRNFTLNAKHHVVSVGRGLTYNAWTYDGTVPGPLLRVRQGDQVDITLINNTTDAHGIYTHAAQIDFGSFTGHLGQKRLSYSFKALVPGVFDYHCTAQPVLDHIASGMFGMMIVDPVGGWPNGEAEEVMLIESEIYGLPDAHGRIRPDHARMVSGRPHFVVFNGVVNRYDLGHPIKIKVGKLVRVFLVNIGPNGFSSFHVIGALFSTVYRSGNPADALHNVQTFELGPGDAAVLEFRVDRAGEYPFLDHGMGRAYKGAEGIFRAEP
jgi:nitrite reductase (NO-forming)